MATTDKIKFLIEAKDRTQKAFSKANNNLSSLEKNANKVKAVGNVFAVLTAGAGAGVIAMNALSDSLIQSLDKLDDIGKASRRLGLTTDELQELRAVAKASGVEISAFDTAFQRFARRAGQARLGTGELIKTFDILGIQLNDNEGNLKSNSALFQEFGDKIASVSDKNTQLALTMSGVDTEGVKLIDMFRTSAKAKQEVINKARELGAVYDGSLIKKAEAYKTEIDLIKDAQVVLNTQADIGLSQMILDWEKLKLGVIETKNELLRYIGWQGVASDNTTKNLIETNKGYLQDIKHFKKKLELEKDPASQKFLKTNLEYAEKAQKATEKEIKDKIAYYEKLSNLESKGGDKKTVIGQIDIDAKGAKKSVTELQKTIAALESQIGRRSSPDSELETIDIVRKSQDAYNSLQSGDTAQAVRDAKEAVRVAEVLRKSGGATKNYLDDMTRQMSDIVKQAAELDGKTINKKIGALGGETNTGNPPPSYESIREPLEKLRELIGVDELIMESGDASQAYLDTMTKQAAATVENMGADMVANTKAVIAEINSIDDISIKTALDTEEMLRQAGASQEEIQNYFDQNPVKMRFTSDSDGYLDDIAHKALQEGIKN